MTPQWLTALARSLSEPLISHVQDGNLVPSRGGQRGWLVKEPVLVQEPRTEAVISGDDSVNGSGMT